MQEARRKGHQVPDVLKERRGSAEEFVEDIKLPRATMAEKARTLLARASSGVLSSLLAPDSLHPYGSLVNLAIDDEGKIFFLVSKMAEHYANLSANPLASVLLSETQGTGDRLAVARATLVGRAAPLTKTPARVQAFLKIHPGATYAHFDDFVCFELLVDKVRYIGGFGEMSWIAGPAFAAAQVDPVSGAPETTGAIAHMNKAHAADSLSMVRKFAFANATQATMLDIDRHGMSFLVMLPDGKRRARVNFAKPLTSVSDLQAAVVDMSKKSKL